MLRKRLSIGSDPTFYEDLSDSIRSGMEMLGYSLTDPLGIALDLLEKKVSGVSTRYVVVILLLLHNFAL